MRELGLDKSAEYLEVHDRADGSLQGLYPGASSQSCRGPRWWWEVVKVSDEILSVNIADEVK